MKNFKTTLIYVVVAALLGGYIYFFERGPVKAKEEKKTKVFANFVADDINEITLENLGTSLTAQQTPIVLKKDSKDVWQIVSPRAMRADDSTVRSMLTGVGDFNPDVTLDNPASLKDYGLDPPVAKATLKSKAGTTFTLLIGGKDISGSSAYVKPADKNTVYMVASFAVDNLKKTVNDYRDHNFLKTDTVVAQKIKVTRDGKTTVFEKDKSNNWNITKPIAVKADSGKIRDLLNTVSSLRASEFVDDHPVLSKYGLSNPRLRVEVWPSDGGVPQGFLIGAKKKGGSGGFYAKGLEEPAVSLVGEYIDKDLDLKTSDYRDKSALQFDAGAVTSLIIKHGSNSFTYLKDNKGQWTCPGRPNAASEASSLVTQLSGLTITDFPEPEAGTGLDQPSYEVQASLSSGVTHALQFGKRDGGKVYVSEDKGGDIYQVSDTVVSQMEGYYSTILTPVPAASPSK